MRGWTVHGAFANFTGAFTNFSEFFKRKIILGFFLRRPYIVERHQDGRQFSFFVFFTLQRRGTFPNIDTATKDCLYQVHCVV